jgi:uncharacterized coiled-coil protein SlyX
MLPLALTELQIMSALPSLGVSGCLAIAVVMLWRKSEARDIEREKTSVSREQRISALEAKADEHADQYRALAEVVTETVSRNTMVMEQTTLVMERVLTRLDEPPMTAR